MLEDSLKSICLISPLLIFSSQPPVSLPLFSSPQPVSLSLCVSSLSTFSSPQPVSSFLLPLKFLIILFDSFSSYGGTILLGPSFRGL